MAIERLLLESGAGADALAGSYGGEHTTMSMLGVECAPRNGPELQIALAEALLDFGAAIEGRGAGDWTSPLMTALAFGYLRHRGRAGLSGRWRGHRRSGGRAGPARRRAATAAQPRALSTATAHSRWPRSWATQTSSAFFSTRGKTPKANSPTRKAITRTRRRSIKPPWPDTTPS